MGGFDDESVCVRLERLAKIRLSSRNGIHSNSPGFYRCGPADENTAAANALTGGCRHQYKACSVFFRTPGEIIFRITIQCTRQDALAHTRARAHLSANPTNNPQLTPFAFNIALNKMRVDRNAIMGAPGSR